MTYIEMLETVNYVHILDAMVSEDEKLGVISDVHRFYQRKHGVPISVLNAVLIRSIHAIKETHGPKARVNEPYLRKTMESFKKMKIRNTAGAVLYLESNASKAVMVGKRERKLNNPKWVQDYLDSLDTEFKKI